MKIPEEKKDDEKLVKDYIQWVKDNLKDGISLEDYLNEKQVKDE